MVEGTLKFENSRIIFRNFSGAPTRFRKEGGRRTFGIPLDEETATRLQAAGWNAKIKPNPNEGEPPYCHLDVVVAFGKRPPKIVVLKGGKQTLLTEDTVGGLDWADIKSCDIAVRPYNWDKEGNSPCTAYLKTLYVTVEEDEFEHKYGDEGFNPDDDDLPF